MIFGKKTDLKTLREKEKEKKRNYFAWIPFHLKDGRWIWLECFWREYWSSWGCCGHNYYLNKDDVK